MCQRLEYLKNRHAEVSAYLASLSIEQLAIHEKNTGNYFDSINRNLESEPDIYKRKEMEKEMDSLLEEMPDFGLEMMEDEMKELGWRGSHH